MVLIVQVDDCILLIEYTIVKSGTIYTITDPVGTTVFQGKQKAHEIRSARLKKKNKLK
jgi:hypothetical protein